MTRPAQALSRGGYRTIGEQATTKWLGNWGLPRLILCPIQYAADASPDRGSPAFVGTSRLSVS